MKIIVISDIHGHTGRISALEPELVDADVLIAAGDLTHFGGARQAHEVVEALTKIAPRVIAITGNCDNPVVRESLREWGVGLDGREVVIGGIRFVGLGGSLPCPGATPNEYSEEEYAAILDCAGVGAEPLVLISHQPPYDTKIDMIPTGLHVGSKSVREFIELRQPLLCISGHIHEACGIDAIGPTRLVNPGAFQGGGFACCEITDGKVEITLKKIRRGH